MCDYGKEIFSGLKDGFKVVGRGDDVWKEMNEERKLPKLFWHGKRKGSMGI